MKFIDVLNVFKGVTITGLGEAARFAKTWGGTITNALCAVFPKNLVLVALKEVTPEIIEWVVEAIETAEKSGVKGKEKLAIANKILVENPKVPTITKVAEATDKVQSIVSLINSVVKEVKEK